MLELARKKTVKKKRNVEKEMEREAERFGRKMEKLAEEGECCHEDGAGSIAVGLILIALGLFFFGNEVGWWAYDLPIWPTILMAVGIIIAVTSVLKR